MNSNYRAIIGALGLALAITTIAACGGKSGRDPVDNHLTTNEPPFENTVDECPRDDGRPCQ